MAIKHVIIHVVKRDKDGERLSKQLRNNENSTQGMTAQLTDGLLELFSNAHLNIGEFGVDGDNEVEPAFDAYSGDGEHRFRFYREHLNSTHWVHDIFNLSVHDGQF